MDLTANKTNIGVKWVCKTKLKHKERLVSKGFSQKIDVDYGETFSLVPRLIPLKMC